MNFIQNTLQTIEVGRGQILVRLIPLTIAVFAIGFFYNFGPLQTPFGSIGGLYHGLNDAQSMDNAQLARQITRGQGFTTEFLRPQALAQLRDFAAGQGLQTGKSHDLFPADRFPPGTPRLLPDTYNAPGYPFLLAVYFHVIRPEFAQVPTAMSANHFYAPDRWIPLLNAIFLLLTAALVFTLGRRLFDDRVAWLALLAFFGTDLMWRYSLTGLSTSVLMFLVMAAFLCVLEIICVSEGCFENEDRTFGPAWLWGFVLALLLGAACLTRLHLLVLLIPLFVLFMTMPRSSFALAFIVTLIVAGMTAPWFFHVYKVSGNPLGSNFALMLYGQDQYKGNQIYCATSIPDYEHLFKDVTSKELTGFRWHLEHAWNLLGSNPLILLFGASILHQFKRRRTRMFHWLLFGSALILIAANNIGSAKPEALDAWNTLVVLFPPMIVIGSAFFFILLDRLNVQMRLLQNLIITTTIAFIIAPLVLSLTTENALFYSFPPYMPPMIKALGQYAQPDEWVTSDMPWATAWYADRGSLWLPDKLSDFQNFHDNVCPTGIILLTPVSWSQPLSTFTTGEYKDWFPFISMIAGDPSKATTNPLPAGFPLSVHTMTAAGGPDYNIWSDRPRWQSR